MSEQNKQIDELLQSDNKCNEDNHCICDDCEIPNTPHKLSYILQILDNTNMLSTEISQNYNYDYVKTYGIKILHRQYEKYLNSFNRDYKIIISASQENINRMIDSLDGVICNLEDLNVAIKYSGNTDIEVYYVAEQVEKLIGEYEFDKSRILITRNKQ